MSQLEWSACCSFFSIPFSVYLRQNNPCHKTIWEEISLYKKWNTCDLGKNQDSFYREYSAISRTQVITWHDSRYPQSLRHLFSPPPCLYYRGSLDLLEKPKLAVVGSRYPSSVFVDWVNHELGCFLKNNDCLIVSGGAVGIDQLATRAALRQGRASVVVVPSGFERLYPRGIDSWREDPNILLLSEYLPQQEMRRHHFLKRNRIIAGLSEQLLVIQCAIKSGSMITVNYAIEMGVPVATVPDFPGKYESSGNLKLLQEGAHFVSQAKDLEDFVRTP